MPSSVLFPIHLKGSQGIVIGILLTTITIHNKPFLTLISSLNYICMCTFKNSFQGILSRFQRMIDVYTVLPLSQGLDRVKGDEHV